MLGCSTSAVGRGILRPRCSPSARQMREPVTGLDFSREMLRLAEQKYAGANVRWVEGDAMALPFPDNSFDLVTSAFGFRNLSNYAAGLREIHRVLRPGGSLGILECNQPGWSKWSAVQPLLSSRASGRRWMDFRQARGVRMATLIGSAVSEPTAHVEPDAGRRIHELRLGRILFARGRPLSRHQSLSERVYPQRMAGSTKSVVAHTEHHERAYAKRTAALTSFLAASGITLLKLITGTAHRLAGDAERGGALGHRSHRSRCLPLPPCASRIVPRMQSTPSAMARLRIFRRR